MDRTLVSDRHVHRVYSSSYRQMQFLCRFLTTMLWSGSGSSGAIPGVFDKAESVLPTVF